MLKEYKMQKKKWKWTKNWIDREEDWMLTNVIQMLVDNLLNAIANCVLENWLILATIAAGTAAERYVEWRDP